MVSASLMLLGIYVGVAQPVEHLPSKQRVAGSIPVTDSMGAHNHPLSFFLLSYGGSERREVPGGLG